MSLPVASPRPRRRAGLRLAVVAAALLGAGAALARGGAYRESAHGNRTTGVLRVAGARRGDCAQCHGAPPNGRGQPTAGRGHTALFAPDDNTLCLTCHRRAVLASSWLGEARYGQASHALSPAMVWPGPQPPARPSADAGKCVNCHDPHGVKDGQGLVEKLLRLRGATLCLGCHNGATGPDVASALSLPFRHPLSAAGPVAATTGLAPATTCAGCHNPHAARPDPSPPRAPTTSRALLGVARVRVSYDTAGAPANLTALPSSDQTAVHEYEVCFKCHAGQGDGHARVDVAADLNPANASFHPVEAQGRNAAIDRRSFASGWSASRQVGCVDCHSGAAGQGRGPHGSSVPHLLKKPYNATLSSQPAAEGELCFDCHAYRTYAALSGVTAGYSRYAGHGSHVSRGLSCFACHGAHGSPFLPALLRLRPQALTAFTPDPAGSGGTCTTACHLAAPPVVAYHPTVPR